MSKYTADDPDVAFLDMGDRVDFEIDMMMHDPDKLAAASHGMAALQDPKKISKQFKSWTTVSLGIIMLLCFIFTILFLIAFIMMIVFYMMEKKNKGNLLAMVLVSVIMLFLILLLLFLFFGKVYGNTQSVVNMTIDHDAKNKAQT